ncbi:unnamed protein product [Paramecium octaurelia]|uniref:PSI domain-containing protein n=1 Tax=Paramecium octaurelia TaxID=43137 RepID=A0A8S1WXX4_PAROT|nr:unnamed protein product [Paramecium octaurelia]
MKILFFLMLLLLGRSLNEKYECSCDQILTEADCLMSHKYCNWNSFKQKCQQDALIVPSQLMIREYCEQFSQSACNKLKPCETCVSNGPCQWYQGICSHFTGCTAFAETDSFKCQQISNRCITDGVYCVEIGVCDSYKTETACKQDMNYKWCFWDNNLNKCRYPQICQELPKTFTFDSQCRSQISTCTTNHQGGQLEPGTVQVTSQIYKSQCKDFTLQSECVKNSDQNLCYWNEIQCVDKICSNAPKILITNSSCQSFLSYCITMNGGGCMNNGKCQVANTLAACDKDIFGIDCFWTDESGCIYKSCDLAPTTLISNYDCDLFLKDKCVIKEGGGCRNKECEDLFGSSHISCWTQKSGCTVGLNSRCGKPKNCEDTTLKEACIEGLNGPCLWIINQFSNEQPQGKCYSYNSCQSIQWNTDQQCKQISPFCTTDGIKCIPITLCSETNTNGGCVTGNDGYCIQTVTAINDNKLICKRFDSCSSANYLIHEWCQHANQMCTSNGVTGCIPLADCAAYQTKESCKVNSYKNPCFWIEAEQICRDKSCSDFSYKTRFQCNEIGSDLKKRCTFDGVQCIDISTCGNYKSKSVCNNAKSEEGSCIWSELEQACNVRFCQDISAPSLYNCSFELANCTFDGTKCIEWEVCTNYYTKTACNTMGLDGICYWSKSGSCQLMTSCKSASDDEQACALANQNCFWNSMGVCQDHYCESFQKSHGTCINFNSWDNQSQIFCQEQQGACRKVDPNTLNQNDCYKVTNYLYTWNPNSSKCTICNPQIKPNINNNNNTNTSSNNNSNNTNSTNNNNNTHSSNNNNTNNNNCTDNSDTDTNQKSTKSSFFLTYFVLFILTVQI